ncbi:hypothetical protein BDZ94DRAFT_1255976 [Collybia nuda]|uniref:Secreted protein n=1 Tax=Collybia nuda TaxID=64659 RepID=A0A9P6CL99_9AGAR|nr:hypothetical protein BDZ94DRAFT_1255976 [Collybia nuda]
MISALRLCAWVSVSVSVSGSSSSTLDNRRLSALFSDLESISSSPRLSWALFFPISDRCMVLSNRAYQSTESVELWAEWGEVGIEALFTQSFEFPL